MALLEVKDLRVHFKTDDGMVKAVGVWDTVGSLGIPRMPLHRGGRREQEVTHHQIFPCHPMR